MIYIIFQYHNFLPALVYVRSFALYNNGKVPAFALGVVGCLSRGQSTLDISYLWGST